MSPEEFEFLLFHIEKDLVKTISEKQGLSEEDARHSLHETKLYAYLVREELKLWYYSNLMLYSLYCEEKETGAFTVPDV